MRGWMIIRWPDDNRNTACFARRVTCSMVLPVSVLTSRALLTSRRTSVLRSCTCAMRRPSRRGAISRTIVSTSGSSGTLDLAPRDVAPPGLAFERNSLDRRAARRCRECHRRPEACHAEHAAAGCPQTPLVVSIRARVKYDHVVTQPLRVGEADRHALLWIVGITARRQDGCDGRSLDAQDLLRRHRIPATLPDGAEVLAEPGQERRQESLGLGLAEAHVEFEDRWRAGRQNHQARVEHAFVRGALRRHLPQDR